MIGRRKKEANWMKLNGPGTPMPEFIRPGDVKCAHCRTRQEPTNPAVIVYGKARPGQVVNFNCEECHQDFSLKK